MECQLAVSVKVAFGLSFDVEKATERKSGFRPAQRCLNADKHLFGDLRLEGFAALLRAGFAEELVVVGGKEGRYPDENICRAWAIREMLVRDLGVDFGKVSSVPSVSNTGGNIAAIKSVINGRGLVFSDCAVVSNLYHLPRTFLDLVTANLPIPIYPAEAFWLLEDGSRKQHLIESFGGGPLAERIAEELQGIANKISGIYKARKN